METLVLLKNLIIFLIIILIAYFVRKTNKVSHNLQKDLSYLLTDVTTPCLVITSMAVEFTNEKLIQARDAFIISNIVFMLSFVAIFLFLKVYKVKEPNRSQMMVGGIFSNLGFLGFPLIQAMFGAEGLYIASIINMVSNYFTYTLGLALIKRNSEKQGKLSVRDFLNNTNIATIIGLIVLFFKIEIPEIPHTVLTQVGDVTGIISMLIIGLMLGELEIKDIFKEKRAYAMSIFRLILFPVLLIVLFALNPIKVNPLVEKICVILFAMPVASITGIFSASYEVDPPFATKIVMMSTIFCIATLPIILSVYNLF